MVLHSRVAECRRENCRNRPFLPSGCLSKIENSKKTRLSFRLPEKDKKQSDPTKLQSYGLKDKPPPVGFIHRPSRWLKAKLGPRSAVTPKVSGQKVERSTGDFHLGQNQAPYGQMYLRARNPILHVQKIGPQPDLMWLLWVVSSCPPLSKCELPGIAAITLSLAVWCARCLQLWAKCSSMQEARRSRRRAK